MKRIIVMMLSVCLIGIMMSGCCNCKNEPNMPPPHNEYHCRCNHHQDEYKPRKEKHNKNYKEMKMNQEMPPQMPNNKF